jgi:DNA-nicking Smr family endonuclease
MSAPNPLQIPLNGILDLHTLRPQEVKDLVPEYLRACQGHGILQVRIIHGKGIGTLRNMVQSILKELPAVDSFRTAEEEAGGWGETIVVLKKLPLIQCSPLRGEGKK